MELISKTIELRKLIASDGKWLTRKGEAVEYQTFAKVVHLAGDEMPEEWEEVTDEEKAEREKQREEIEKHKEEELLKGMKADT